MNKLSVIINEVSRHYNKVIALDKISVSIKKGEIFGFIGPDGAGKTSLFRILTTLLFPHTGYITIEELDVVKDFKKIRKIIGYMPSKFSLYQDLSVEENLAFFANIFHVDPQENQYLIKDIYHQIEPFRKRPASKLSGGMKQKLALSCALIHKPQILILDEPTTGVDSVSRKEFWELLKKLQQYGITIIVSTPYMDEASLCDRVALIQNGEVLDIDSPHNIQSKYPYDIVTIKSSNMYDILKDAQLIPHTKSAFRFGDCIHVSYNKNQINIDEMTTILKEKGHDSISINSIEASIEDSFMALMNKKN
ncbi:MAG: ABC transporter ATP-binding protein [Bacteroidetes bacterium]|nr:ABC transporter ATP-binding protein [Bacteroidota bacterium]